MKLTAYSYTNQGGRDHNEDSVRCLTEAGVFVLADGLGGHQCGEVASGLAADVIAAGCAEAAPTPASLLELFQKANEAILDAQKTPGREDMKTTAVALSIPFCVLVFLNTEEFRYALGLVRARLPFGKGRKQ